MAMKFIIVKLIGEIFSVIYIVVIWELTEFINVSWEVIGEFVELISEWCLGVE